MDSLTEVLALFPSADLVLAIRLYEIDENRCTRMTKRTYTVLSRLILFSWIKALRSSQEGTV